MRTFPMVMRARSVREQQVKYGGEVIGSLCVLLLLISEGDDAFTALNIRGRYSKSLC